MSLWNVDDAATNLLMTRFYQNLLGRRPSLERSLPKAEALAEAKQWLRSRSASDVQRLSPACRPWIGSRRSSGHLARPRKRPIPTSIRFTGRLSS